MSPLYAFWLATLLLAGCETQLPDGCKKACEPRLMKRYVTHLPWGTECECEREEKCQ